MLEISNLKVPCGSSRGALKKKIAKLLRTDAFQYTVVRHSIDARRKPELYDVYSVHAELRDRARETRLAEKLAGRGVRIAEPAVYRLPAISLSAPFLKERPVVVGCGPAGLFAALTLAECGFRPLLIERGAPIAERTADVERFFLGGKLNPSSNIQFGEGGAGTFSDGKLTTNVRDPFGRNARVLDLFVEAGAPADIRSEQLPHIGTDVLRKVIVNLRERLLAMGGEVRFHTRAADLIVARGAVRGLVVEDTRSGEMHRMAAEAVILAPGHSARDTFRTLHGLGVAMRQKAFAVGLRISHPQALIDHRQYGISDPEALRRLRLPAASYKLTAQLPSGRGVYSFCMCPGGYVVNASSQEGLLAVNGMSLRARDSLRANSAIVLTVGREAFGADDPLAGLRFQEQLEKKAFALAEGRIPVQRYPVFKAAFLSGSARQADGSVPLSPEELSAFCLKGQSAFAPLSTLLPRELTADLIEGIDRFDRIIPGFAGPDALLAGLESRTSSPLRIERDGERFEASLEGLYPAGEGAGYAGGIMSAAIDGIKVAEAVIRQYRPPVS